MIIYSAMPLELIFENFHDVENQQVEEIRIGTATMLIQPTGKYEGKIIRLISPDPQDYLNPSYAPGQKIFFRPDLT
jgi:hypothetical protein